MTSGRSKEDIPAEDATEQTAAPSEPEQTGAEQKDESPSTNYGKYFEADKNPEDIAEGTDVESSILAMIEHMKNLQLDPVGKATWEKIGELASGNKEEKSEEKSEKDKAETPENTADTSAAPPTADTAAAARTDAPPLPPRHQQAHTETAGFNMPTASQTPSKKEEETVDAAKKEEVEREVVKEGAAATIGAPRELTDPLVDKAMDEYKPK